MSVTIDEALSEFASDDTTVKLVETVLKTVPGAPDYLHWGSLDEAALSLGADAAALRSAAAGDDVSNVIWMSRLLDTGDAGYAIFTGVSSALSFFFGKKSGSEALETDKQQRNDAVLKALGIAYLAWKAFPGTIAERATAFKASSAGQALMTYYAAVEVGLPFADNALLKSGQIMDSLLADGGAGQVDRLAGMAGGKDLSGVETMLRSLSGGMRSSVEKVAPYVGPIAQKTRQYVPGALGAVDKVAGVIATGADVMPVYRLLGARLAVEAAAARA